MCCSDIMPVYSRINKRKCDSCNISFVFDWQLDTIATRSKWQKLSLLMNNTESTNLALSKHWNAFCFDFKEAQGRSSCVLAASSLMTGPWCTKGKPTICGEREGQTSLIKCLPGQRQSECKYDRSLPRVPRIRDQSRQCTHKQMQWINAWKHF